MAEVDTSSYPKPQQTNFLDTAGKYQGLAQGAVTLSQQKLKLMNDQWQTLASELSTMANDPNTTKEQAAGRLTSFAKMANIPQPMVDKELAELQASPDVTSWAKTQLVRGQSAMDRVHLLYGQQSYIQTGQGIHPVLQGPMVGVKQNGPTIPVQPPPTSEVVDQNSGQKRMLGSQPEPNVLPPSPSGNYRPAPTNKLGGAVQSPQTNVPSGPATSVSPMWETGQKQYVADQNEGSQTFTQLRPLLQAIPLAKQLTTGPTTETLNNVAATLKNLGVIDIKDNDPTAMYQELNKKLEQYVSQHGSRSDSDLAHTYASNPNAKTQIQPALVKLAQDQVALDRINAVRALAFKDQDFSKYGQYRTLFPAKMDPRAFNLDTLDAKERATLVQNMAKGLKSKSGAERQAAKRFFDSLRIAKEYVPQYQEMNEQQ